MSAPRQAVALTVVYDAADAGALGGAEPDADRLLALTPRARDALTTLGRDFITTTQVYGPAGHARCVARLRRAERRLARAMAHGSSLGPAARAVLLQYLHQFGSLASRSWSTLGSAGPWQVPTPDGGWRCTSDRRIALRLLVARVLHGERAVRSHAARPPLPRLYAWLRRRVARRAAQRGGWVAGSPAKFQFGLQGRIVAAGTGVASLTPTSGGLTDYRDLLSAWRSLSAGSTGGLSLGVMPLADRDPLSRELDRLVAELRDPVLSDGLQAARDYLVDLVGAAAGIACDGVEVISALRASAAVATEANTFRGAGLLEAAGKAGVPAIVVNHNSQTCTGDPFGDEVMRGLVRRRIANPLVSHCAVWTPHTVALVEALRDAPAHPRVVALELPPQRSAAPTQPGGRLRLLHAGNFQGWRHYFPWIAETSDEYVDGLVALVGQIATLDFVELEIRVRPKDEVDADSLRRLLPVAANCTVTGTDEPFAAQLARSDALVTFFSTTVEQALQARIPVLLWGHTERFRHFRGRTEPAGSGDRAAVYVCEHPHRLTGLLRGLHEHHRGQPLTAGEVGGYQHPSSASPLDLDGLATLIATRSSDVPGSERAIPAATERLT